MKNAMLAVFAAFTLITAVAQQEEPTLIFGLSLSEEFSQDYNDTGVDDSIEPQMTDAKQGNLAGTPQKTDNEMLSEMAATESDDFFPNLGSSVGFAQEYDALADRYAAESGEFRFDFPIALPDVPGYPLPHLSISYSSESGNGILGQGMRLSGLSSIERDKSKRITFGAGDGFLLDGQKILQGEDGYWHTSRENFLRIESSYLDSGSGNDFWKTTDKNGILTFYGLAEGETESLSDGYHIAKDYAGKKAAAWHVRKVEDSVGRFWSVKYSETLSQGSIYPIQVVFGARNQSGTKRGTVDFFYETRSDSIESYSPSYAYTNLRLAWIVVKLDEYVVRKYRIEYTNATSTGLSRISKISEYGSDGNSPTRSATDARLYESYTPTGTILPSNIVTWGTLKNSAIPTAETVGASSTFKQTLIGDFDGNGVQDLAALSQPSSGLSITKVLMKADGTKLIKTIATGSGSGIWNRQQALSGDFDGDGLDDILFAYSSSGAVHIRIFYSLADGTTTTGTHITGMGDGLWNKQAAMVGDANGDGRDDLIFAWNNGSKGLQVRALLGSENRATRFSSPVLTQFGDGDAIWQNGPGRIGDFNGDGCADIFFHYTTRDGWFLNWDYTRYGRIKLGTPSGSFTSGGSVEMSGSDSYYHTEPEIGDFNGDGKTDAVYLTKGGLVVFFSTGNSAIPFAKHSEFSNNFGGTPNYRFVYDMNGDGSADLQTFTYYAETDPIEGGITEEYYKGERFLSKGNGSFVRFSTGQSSISEFAAGRILQYADMNGDGSADACQTYVTGSNKAISVTLNPYGEGSYVTALKTSHGATITPSYDMATSLPGVIDTSQSSYPSIANRRAQWLLVAVEASGPTMATQKTTISYQNRRLELGLSSGGTLDLGFRQIARKNSAGVAIVRSFFQTRGLHSLLEKTAIVGSDNITYSTVNYSYKLAAIAPATPGDAISFVAPEKVTSTLRTSESKTYSLSISYEYDGFGNLTLEHLTGSDVDGDETKRVTEWIVPFGPGSWIMKPKKVTTYRSNSSSVYHVESETWMYYDNMIHGSVETGLLTKVARLVDTTPEYEEEHFEYTANGQVWKHWDSRATSGLFGDAPTQVTEYDSDFAAFPVESTDAVGLRTIYQRDNLKRVVSVTDPNAQVSATTYDAFGRVLNETLPLETGGVPTRTYTYNDTASPRAVITGMKDSEGSYLLSYSYFDELDRPVQMRTEAAQGKWTVSGSVYDGSGRLIKSIRPFFATGYAFASFGEAIGTQFLFDTAGRAAVTIHEDGTKSRTLYGAAFDGAPAVYGVDQRGFIRGRVERLAETRVSRYLVAAATNATAADIDSYIPYSTITRKLEPRKASLSDDAGASSSMEYDLLGRPTKLVDSTMGTTLWDYAPDRVVMLDAMGASVVVLNDRAGRPIARIADGQTSEWRYDEADHSFGLGRLTSASFERGSDSFEYDARGRQTVLKRTLDGRSRSLVFTYDPMDRPLTESLPGGEILSFTYDGGGRLASLVSSLGGAVLSGDRLYDARGALRSWSFQGQAGTSLAVEYKYYDTPTLVDAGTGLAQSGRLASIHASAAGEVLSLDYSHDEAGNVLERRDLRNQSRTQLYTYDIPGRLIAANLGSSGSRSYTYDQVDRFISKDGRAYTYDSLSPYRIHFDGAFFYSYDAAGRPISRSDGQAWTWGPGGILESTTIVGRGVENYAYDAADQRTIKTGSDGSTYYFFPSYEEEVVGATTRVRKHYYADGLRVAMRDGEGLKALVSDLLGSSTIMVDSGGNLVWEQGYEPFGELLYEEGVAEAVYTFTGKEMDSSGAYYFGARYHDAELGRFLSPDPLALDLDYRWDEQETRAGKVDLFSHFGGGLDWYEYCSQNPVNYTDPTGLFTDPLKGAYTVTGKFGSAYSAGRGSAMDRHAGIDFVSSTREVIAARSGTVLFAAKHPDGISTATGTLIIIDYGDKKYGLYGHLDPDALSVSVGSVVAEGADLGKYFAGSMGTSTDGHLHYEEYNVPDAPSDKDALARLFNGTGYFYDTDKVPDDMKAKNSAGTYVTVVKPDKAAWVAQ